MIWPDFTDPRILAFFTIFAIVFGLAIKFGGWPERLGALVLLAMPVGQLAFYSLISLPEYDKVDLAALGADAVGLIGFGLIAYFADRDHWPIWAIAMTVLSALAHFARIFTEMLEFSYAQFTVAPTAVLVCVVMAGTAAHQYRLRKYGEDRDWTPVAKYGEFRRLAEEDGTF